MKLFTIACAMSLLFAGQGVHAGDTSRVLLEADFDDQPLDQRIAAGGAALGQPVTVSPELSAIVRAGPRPTPSLELSHALPGFARFARFAFLDNQEITHGDLIIRVTVRPAQLGYFDINLRETGTSTQVFLQLFFSAQGDISVSDANGSAGIVATYAANVDHRLRIEYHMDRGTYDIEVDGMEVLSERSHGITSRGIGALLVGTSSATIPGHLTYVDNIRVVRGDGIFSDGFD